MKAIQLMAGIILYCFFARLILTRIKGSWREAAFALANLMGYYALYVRGSDDWFLWGMCLYIPVVGVCFLAMHWYSRSKTGLFWIAFWAPISSLILARYLDFPALASQVLHCFSYPAPNSLPPTIAPFTVGLSYLAFRCSRLTLEVRNGEVERPGIWSYLAFCFFVPTMSVGPINTYQNYRRGFVAGSFFPSNQPLPFSDTCGQR